MRILSFVPLLAAACGPSIPHPVAKPAGCPIALYEQGPPGIADSNQYWYFRDVQVECPKSEAHASCVRRLQDRACAVGAELLYVVTTSDSYQSDGTVVSGKPAMRR